MAAVTRRSSPDAPDECRNLYFGGVRVGTIAIRTGMPPWRRSLGLGRRGELLKRQRRPILRPVDDLEKHSPLDHFGLEIGRVLFPVRCFADAESGFPTLCLGRIIRCQRPAHALVHHGEAVVREGLIVHRATTLRRDEDAILGWTFKGPRALTPPVPGATANPERWLWTSLWTLKEGASNGGPPDFRARSKSIGKSSVNSLPHPAKAKEKPAGLSWPLGRQRVSGRPGIARIAK